MIKKCAVFTVLTFAIYAMGTCQLSVRPQVGINFASLSEDVLDGNWKGNVGYQFGADVQIGGNVYFQPGLNFESTKLTLEDVGDLEVNRINIPVLIGFRLVESSSLGVRAFAGPNFAINVKEELSDAFQQINKDNVRDSQVSGIIGGGVDIGALFVDVGYKIGLSKYFEDINEDASNNIFVANAGLRIGF